jgi:hypothetical protein
VAAKTGHGRPTAIAGIGPAEHLRGVGSPRLSTIPASAKASLTTRTHVRSGLSRPAMSARRTSVPQSGCCSGCYGDYANSPTASWKRSPMSGRRPTSRRATLS